MRYRSSLLWALALAPFLAGAAFLLNGVAAPSPGGEFVPAHRTIDTHPSQALGRRYWIRLEPGLRRVPAARQSVGV